MTYNPPLGFASARAAFGHVARAKGSSSVASIFKRINDLVKANINDLLGRVEDPEKMLNQLMTDLRDEKKKAQLQVVRCIADEKRLEQQVRDHQDKLRQWQQRAEVAVLRDEDELAREAISRRNEYATMVEELTRQWEEQHQMAEQLKDALDQLDRRYKEAEFRKQHLLNRHRAAVATQKAAETMVKLTRNDHLEGFGKVEERIQEIGALASANAEMQRVDLDDRFRQLESEGVVEHDLMQLKLQLGKPIPQLGSANGSGPTQASLPGARPSLEAPHSPPAGQGPDGSSENPEEVGHENATPTFD